MPTRTLIRRLAQLVAEHRIRVEGGSKNTRYYPATAPTSTEASRRWAERSLASTIEPLEDLGSAGETAIPLSPEGAEVRSLVRRPLSARQPVGYHPEFLEEYQPGVTWYLPAHTRDHLLALGRTPDGPQPAGTYARMILSQLLIDLSWGSSRLEGNTYSRLDTKNLLEFGQRATGKDARDAQMILNHRSAIDMLVEYAEEIGFNRYTFLNLHALLAENLLSDPADEGRLRGHLVGITQSTYTPPGVPQQVEEWCDMFLQKAGAITNAFEQAFFVLVQLPYLQPFADVNKRTARLGANIPFIQGNLLPLSFVDVPEQDYTDGMLGVYELNRIELLRDVFVWAYARSVKQYRVIRDAMGDPDPLRLRYRAELRDVVQFTVRRDRPPRREDLEAWARAHDIDAADVSGFAERALELLVTLHEGSLARYGLRPSELLHWKAAVTAAPKAT